MLLQPPERRVATADDAVRPVLQVEREAHYDCDGDTLLLVVEQEGAGACHTGEYSCFFRSFSDPDVRANS